jgi:hypothetical protein
VEGSSLVTLSDRDGQPRLQLKVDSLGKASITFLDSSGRVVRTIKPRVRVIQFGYDYGNRKGSLDPSASRGTAALMSAFVRRAEALG